MYLLISKQHPSVHSDNTQPPSTVYSRISSILHARFRKLSLFVSKNQQNSQLPVTTDSKEGLHESRDQQTATVCKHRSEITAFSTKKSTSSNFPREKISEQLRPVLQMNKQENYLMYRKISSRNILSSLKKYFVLSVCIKRYTT